jgi:hypothetical protein
MSLVEERFVGRMPYLLFQLPAGAIADRVDRRRLMIACDAGATWNVALNTYYFRLVPDRLIGRVSSVGSLASFGALPLGSLAGGLLVQAGGPVPCCAVLAAGMAVLAAITTLSPSVRHGPPLSAGDQGHRQQRQGDGHEL